MCTRRVVYGLAKFAVIHLLQCQLERFLELFLSWCWWSLESAVCFSVLRECSFCRFVVLCIVYLRTLCIRLSLLLFLHDVAFHWRAITLVAASPMSVRCQSGTFTPFPTQLVLHSENHTLDSGDGRLDRRRIVRDRQELAFGKARCCWK